MRNRDVMVISAQRMGMPSGSNALVGGIDEGYMQPLQETVLFDNLEDP